MSIIHVQHIEANCRTRFASLIDMSDVTTKDAEQKDNQFLSRALAAFAVSATSKTDDLTAAKAVVDEYQDDGIDAFYFDHSEHVAYLVQSKWIKDGNGSPDLGSILKFIQGINHFLENKVTMLGPKLQSKSGDIQDALADSQARFILIVAYTGIPPLSTEVSTPLNQLLADLNDVTDVVSLQVLNQKKLHDIVEEGAMGESVDLAVMLNEFGKVTEPYLAYYGQVDISDFASWAKYGDRLYHKNIRSFKGSTEVNDSIVATIKDAPEKFLYFNNGITLLCASIDKKPLGGKSKTSGVFDCKGASVINGAQTVGSILSVLGTSSAPTARVMVRLISLENCPPNFAFDVTKAANTQNRIEKRDFAALDPEQTRLRSEMLLSLGKEYVFRTGDQPPAQDKGCTLDEATIALACAQADATHAVNAKQAVGRFYEDISKAPYTILFNSSVTAVKLWRAVEVLRSVDAVLKDEQRKREGKEKLCAVHGNRVLLHLVFQTLSPALFDETKNVEAEMKKIPELTSTFLDKITEEISKYSPPSYVGNVFKNITKCRDIVKAIA
ncbi:MAG TPA: AIPR family protein [Candidatus Acidoferrales bacterium]|nr:AIPR family protein [Candidatus Acidoferrales bacterium]